MNKYYVNENRDFTNWRGFLELEEKDITEKIELQDLVYVEKTEIDNIQEYNAEDIGSNESIDAEEAKNYLCTNLGETFDFEEQAFLLKNWFDEDYTDEEEEEKKKEIIKKFKAECVEMTDLDTYLAYDYWDGSNWKEEILEHGFYDTQWENWTEELQDMEEIDFERYNTGHYTLYKIKDNSYVVTNTSYYQGSGTSIYFLNAQKNIKTVDDAFKIINEEEENYEY